MKLPGFILQVTVFSLFLHSVFTSLNQTYINDLNNLSWKTHQLNSISLPWVRDRSGFCDSDFCFFTNCKALENSDVLEVSVSVERNFLQCLISDNTLDETSGKYFNWRTSLRDRGFNIKISNFTLKIEGEEDLINVLFSESNPSKIESMIEIHREAIEGLKGFLDDSLSEGRFILRFFVGLKCGYTDTEVFVNDWFFVFSNSCSEENQITSETTSTTSSSTETSELSSSTETFTPNCYSKGCNFNDECNENEFCNINTCQCESSLPEEPGLKLSELWLGLLFSFGSCAFFLVLCFCLSFLSTGNQGKKFNRFETFNNELFIFDGKELFEPIESVDQSGGIQKTSRKLIEKIDILNENHRDFFTKNLFMERYLVIPYIENHGNYGPINDFFQKEDISSRFPYEQRLYFCFCLLSSVRILRSNEIGILHTRLTPSSFFVFSNEDSKSTLPFKIKLFGSHIYGSLETIVDKPNIREDERFHYYPPETNEENSWSYSRESENWVVGMTIWSLFNMKPPFSRVKDKSHYDTVVLSGTRPDMDLFQSEIGIDKNTALREMLQLDKNQRRKVEDICLDWFI